MMKAQTHGTRQNRNQHGTVAAAASPSSAVGGSSKSAGSWPATNQSGNSDRCHEDLKAKLNIAASNREYDLLKEQIEADQQANAVLSDEILEGLEQLDVLEQQVQLSEEEFKKTEAEQKARTAETEQRLISVRKDLEHLNSEREKAEAQLPAEIKADYLRVTAAKGEDALAPVENDSCGGCYQTLTTQVRDQLRLSRLVRCPSCSAFLYLAEDTRVT